MTLSTTGSFFEQIKPCLHRGIDRQVRLARRVVDLGCGSCDLVRHLVESYRQEVTGVDALAAGIPSRRRTADGSRFHCLKRDAQDLSFAKDQSADAVVSMWAMHEMTEPASILREGCRVLRPGGGVFIVLGRAL